MKRYYRTDGDYLGLCECGCQTPVHERIWRTANGGIGCRSRPRFAPGHSLRVNRADHIGTADITPAMAARRALILPLGLELHEAIQNRRRELGLTTGDMQALLGWKGRNNLHRYRYKPNVMRSTLERVLDRLYADEGGWVEAEPLWTLVRNRQATWGASDAEMAAVVGAKESRWVGKDTARRVLLSLSSPRRACEYEKGRAA